MGERLWIRKGGVEQEGGTEEGVWDREDGVDRGYEGGSWSEIKFKYQGWNVMNTTLLLGINL